MAPLSSIFQGNPSRALELERQMTRDKFFKGDERISNRRLDNRLIQQNLEDKFRRENLTRGTGVTGLTQKRDPLGQDFSEFRRQVANRFGPTLSDIGSDIRSGIGRFFDDFRAKGPPVIQAIRTAGQGFLDFLNRPVPQNQMVGTQRQTFDPQLLAQINQGASEMNEVNSLNATQRDLYNMLRKDKGFSHAEAFAQASSQFQMANGGIATLQ